MFHVINCSQVESFGHFNWTTDLLFHVVCIHFIFHVKICGQVESFGHFDWTTDLLFRVDCIHFYFLCKICSQVESFGHFNWTTDLLFCVFVYIFYFFLCVKLFVSRIKSFCLMEQLMQYKTNFLCAVILVTLSGRIIQFQLNNWHGKVTSILYSDFM